MVFDFQHFESFGRKLSSGPDEVEFRNSISRGYYAFYHKMRSFYGRKDMHYDKHDEFIQSILNDKRLKQRAPLSNFLKSAFMKRVEADYKRVPLDHTTRRPMDFNLGTCKQFWGQYDLYAKLLQSESLEENE